MTLRERWSLLWQRFLAWQAANRAAHEQGDDSACCANPERGLATRKRGRRR